MLLCLREPPVRFLWCYCSSFHFWSSFRCCSSFCWCSSFTFSFWHHPSPFRGLWPGFYTHFILSVQSIAEWFRNTFIFNHSVIFLPRTLRPWVGIFLPTGVFCLTLLHRHFKPAFIKASLGASCSSLKFAGLHADPRNTDPAHLFVWFTVIHNLHIQNDSVLNSTIYYHELLVVKA